MNRICTDAHHIHNTHIWYRYSFFDENLKQLLLCLFTAFTRRTMCHFKRITYLTRMPIYAWTWYFRISIWFLVFKQSTLHAFCLDQVTSYKLLTNSSVKSQNHTHCTPLKSSGRNLLSNLFRTSILNHVHLTIDSKNRFNGCRDVRKILLSFR